ncbi:MAG: antibiotic biosynthesis monooxygenase [Candidatus Rokubacteria bacterium]|nr:antibiotic biosynthesis monooxygenase [Candidatus Rokubacteria bacterium]
MYVLLAELKIQPDEVEAFGRVIDRQAKDSVEREKDCHQFDVCQQETDPSVFLLYEIYSDKAAFDQHMKMPYTTQFFTEANPMIANRNIRGFKRRWPVDK